MAERINDNFNENATSNEPESQGGEDDDFVRVTHADVKQAMGQYYSYEHNIVEENAHEENTLGITDKKHDSRDQNEYVSVVSDIERNGDKEIKNVIFVNNQHNGEQEHKGKEEQSVEEERKLAEEEATNERITENEKKIKKGQKTEKSSKVEETNRSVNGHGAEKSQELEKVLKSQKKSVRHLTKQPSTKSSTEKFVPQSSITRSTENHVSEPSTSSRTENSEGSNQSEAEDALMRKDISRIFQDHLALAQGLSGYLLPEDSFTANRLVQFLSVWEKLRFSDQRNKIRALANKVNLNHLKKEDLYDILNAMMKQVYSDVTGENKFTKETMLVLFFFCSDLLKRMLREKIGVEQWYNFMQEYFMDKFMKPLLPSKGFNSLRGRNNSYPTLDVDKLELQTSTVDLVNGSEYGSVFGTPDGDDYQNLDQSFRAAISYTAVLSLCAGFVAGYYFVKFRS